VISLPVNRGPTDIPLARRGLADNAGSLPDDLSHRPEVAQEVLLEQIKVFYKNSLQGGYVNIPGLIIFAASLWNIGARAQVIIWLIAAISTDVIHQLSARRSYPFTALNIESAPRYARRFTIALAIAAVIWGGAGFFIALTESASYELWIVAALSIVGLAACTGCAGFLPAIYCWLVPTTLSLVINLTFFSNLLFPGIYLAFGMVVVSVAMLMFSHNFHQVLTTSILLNIRNRELAAENAAKKEEAEKANQSKSRFLAAASHDLRQPIHTLGLFVAAAKHPTTVQEHALIIDRIESAVGSLTVLFDSLLDISRLDAGILQAQIKIVALRPILQKLAIEHEPEANAKNLKFRFHCPDIAVRTDPLLLEQMIRNLVSNALRYTNTGGVLVAGRNRGSHARIEVWDTGIGIAPEKQRQVFEEFYQIGNAERDRRHGVGLGLAIVKRIAALLHHPLRLDSRVGRGSRFSVEVPIGAIRGEAAGLTNQITYDDDTVLLGTVIVVIDDEADILAALELLLKQWGCVVIAADSGAQAQDKLQRAGIAPDLILSDYRLRDNETGIGVIDQLRSTFGDHVPALLVTGDTAAERLRDATASGLDVLHKPVKADQLKQALIKTLG
jgi:two-component system, sensor histidine kinase